MEEARGVKVLPPGHSRCAAGGARFGFFPPSPYGKFPVKWREIFALGELWI